MSIAAELPEKVYGMRVRYLIKGGHVHMKIYSGILGAGFGLAGELVLTKEEFEAWHKQEMRIEFLREDWAAR